MEKLLEKQILCERVNNFTKTIKFLILFWVLTISFAFLSFKVFHNELIILTYAIIMILIVVALPFYSAFIDTYFKKYSNEDIVNYLKFISEKELIISNKIRISSALLELNSRKYFINGDLKEKIRKGIKNE